MVSLRLAAQAAGNGSADWSIEEHVRRFVGTASAGRWDCPVDDQWLYATPRGSAQRAQGWKLHISGTVLSAEEILTRALPLLVSTSSAFKVARNLGALESLCATHASRESAGKFITIYPTDDATCGALAAQLDARLAGLDGPVVLSDLQYRPGSLVSCRYGGFAAMYTLSADGDIRPAIMTPGGKLVEDRRQAWHECPPWTSPPPGFRQIVRSIEASGQSRRVLLADRFLVIQALRLTAKGGVYVVRDLEAAGVGEHNAGEHSAGGLLAGDLVVIKQARPHIGLGPDGIDARSFLLNEWSVLHLLAGTGVTPLPVALFQHDGDLFMAEEFASGTRLDRWARQYQPGPHADGSDAALLTALERLCDAVGEFHARGLVIRDLSPTNVIVDAGVHADGVMVRICDLEHVAFSGTAPSPIGTPGFNPPEQRVGKAVRPPSDLYALGALIFYICTGEAPLLGRDDRPGRSTAERISALLRTCAQSRRLQAMAGLVVALLADDPAERPSLAAVKDRLRQALRSLPAGDPATAGAAEGAQSAAPVRLAADAGGEATQVEELAADLVGHLAATWAPAAPQPWYFADYGRPDAPIDVYSGVAGIIGVLAKAAAAGDYPAALPVLDSAADWLKDRHQPGGADRPGLMLGDSGIAWALGLAHAAARSSGQGGRSRHSALKAELMNRLRSARPVGPLPPNDDYLYGTAGAIVARAGLLQAADASDLTRADVAEIRDQLAMLCTGLAARHAPDAATNASGADGSVSRSGTHDRTESGAEPLPDCGFAHGMAGIGYGFLAGGLMLGDETLIGHATRFGRRIIEAASFSGDQAWWRGGTPRSPQFSAHWCRGSAGVATFLIRLWWFAGEAAALATAHAGARAALAGRAGAPACMCHGLAGTGELMLDLAVSTGEPHYVDAARSIADQLWDLRVRRDGRWLVPDESGARMGVDYGVGSSGVAAFLLRLLHGGRRLWTADDVPLGPKAAGFPAFTTSAKGGDSIAHKHLHGR